jgi:hypothetical protein
MSDCSPRWSMRQRGGVTGRADDGGRWRRHDGGRLEVNAGYRPVRVSSKE